MFIDLKTERLILKNISVDDRDFILEQFSNVSVNQYLFDAEPLSSLSEADDIIAFYTQDEPRLQHRWIMIQKDSGQKIGTCGFHCWDKDKRVVDVGYDLQKEYWRMGYMKEALSEIITFAEQKMDIVQIDAHISIENVASIMLAEKMGFVFYGKTENCMFRGKDYPHKIYSRLCKNANG